MLSAIDKFCQILERVITKLDSIGFNKVVSYTIYLLALVVIFNWKSVATTIYEVISKYKVEETIKSIETRESIDRSINNIIKDLRVKCNADRVVLYEYHNTVKNISGLHFRFVSIVSEDAEVGLPYIGQKYQSLNTGLLSDFTTELSNNNCIRICMSDESDKRYPMVRYMLESDGTGCAYFSIIQGDSYPLGFISVQWTGSDSGCPDHSLIHSYMQSASLKITALLNKIH